MSVENEFNKEYFSKQYYNSGCGVNYHDAKFWQEGFGRIADLLVANFHPTTLLDVGCAFGYLVAALRDRGVEAYGLDISEYAISQVREDIRPFCRAGSALDPLPDGFPARFSLLTTIEVAEHLLPEDSDAFLKNICSYSDRIIFSSTPDNKEEPTHFNVHPASYWREKFFANGFWNNYVLKPYYVSPQGLFFYRPQGMKELWDNYELTYQFEECRHKEELDAILADRAKAQEIMDVQASELEKLRPAYAALETDRAKAQEIMDMQASELEKLRPAYAALETDRAKAQEIMDTQASKLEKLRSAYVALETDRAKVQDIIDAQEAELVEVKAKIQKLQDEYEALASSLGGRLTIAWRKLK